MLNGQEQDWTKIRCWMSKNRTANIALHGRVKGKSKQKTPKNNMDDINIGEIRGGARV